MSVEKTDGRGLVSGIYVRTNREITRPIARLSVGMQEIRDGNMNCI